jgi:phosphatidylglycerophosphate synthase
MITPTLAVVTSRGGVSVDPMTRVAGLGLLLRVVLTLQGAGIARIVVALPEQARSAFDAVCADRRTTADLEFHARGESRPALATTDGPHLDTWITGERVVLACYDVIAPAALYRALIAGDDADDATGEMTTHWTADASTPGGRRDATRALFNDCRKPVDGIVSRHLNRHISLFVSRLLVEFPVSPNMLTGATFSVAIAAAYFAAQGGYQAVATAGVLMQLGSILDGCDGELARVRFEGSKLGQWLDTLGDDASNVMFWAALGVGAQQLQPYGWYFAMGAWIAAASNAVAALANYAVLAKIGSGDFYALTKSDRAAPGAVVTFFETILKQDFFLFLVMCLALGGVLEVALPVIAIGGVITMIHSGLRSIRFFAARAQPSPTRTSQRSAPKVKG